MSDAVVIERRFHGPPDSGNGGYCCGLLAGHVGDGPVEVTLKLPPPLDRPMALRPDGDDGVALVDGDQVVAVGRATELTLAVPPAVSADQAAHAAATFDVDAYRGTHPFAGCFTCGPDRPAGDGLRIFPAPVADGVVAWPWVPDDALPTTAGAVDPEIVWAALDCPGGLAWIAGPDGEPAVLGRMTAFVHRRPVPGEQLVGAGWRIDAEGRRRVAGSAIVGTDGEVLARARAVWVVLSPEQQQAFRAGT